MLRPIISLILCFSLFLTHAGLAEVGQTVNLANYLNSGPKTLSPLGFQAPVLRYFSYDASADNFQLLLDPQDLKDKLSEDQTKVLAQEQLNYFMVGLTLPNSKFWVNLRPDAPDNIIEPELEQTEVGRIMLAADLQLKKDTANWTSPQTKEGREYWDKLYQKAKELFGSEPANIPTITRPWIVPGEILIREAEGAASAERSRSAYVYKATLKVMLEEDYLKSSQLSAVGFQQYTFKDPRMKELNVYSSQLIRELILPKLTQEVNSGKNYAPLRQVYFSLVLSRWFKQRFQKVTRNQSTETRENLIRLIDSGDLTNLTSKQPWSKETYFNQYKQSFSQGEYNLQEEVSTPTGQVIRSYVSGGGYLVNIPLNNVISSKNLGNLPLLPGSQILNGNERGDVSLSASPLSVKDVRKRIKAIKGQMKLILDMVLGFGKWEKLSDKEKEKIDKRFNNLPIDPYSFTSLYETEIYKIGDGEEKLDSLREFLSPVGRFRRTLAVFKEIKEKDLDNEMENQGLWQKLFKRGEVLVERNKKQKDIEHLFNAIEERVSEIYSEITQLLESEFAELEKRTEELRALLSKYASATGKLVFVTSARGELVFVPSATEEGVSVSLQSLIEKLPKILETRTGGFLYSTSTTIGIMIKEIIEILQKASLTAVRKYEVESEQFVSLEELSSFINKIISSLNTRLNETVNKSILSDIVFDNLNEEQKTILDNLRQTIASLSKDFQELKAKIESSPFLSQPKPSSTSSNTPTSLAIVSSALSPEERLSYYINDFLDGLSTIFTKTKNAIKESLESTPTLLEEEREKMKKYFNNGYKIFLNDYHKPFIPWEQVNWKAKGIVPVILPELFEAIKAHQNNLKKELKELEEIKKEQTASGTAEEKEIYDNIYYSWVSYLLLSLYNNFEALNNKLILLNKEIEKGSANSGKSGSPLASKLTEAASVVALPGGIDFTDIEKYLQYDGSFKGIDLSLPLLSKQELEGLDLEKEEEIVRNYLATGYNPHGDRLKRLLAGLFQKDEFTSKQLDLLRLSQNLCNFLSARGLETTPDQRAFILITNTGLFLKQGQGKASITPSLN